MNKYKRTFLVSFITATIGAALTFWGFYEPSRFDNTWPLVVMAAMGAMCSGAFCWWFFVERSQQAIHHNHIVAGLVCGIIAHPVIWLIVYISIGVLNVPNGDLGLGELSLNFAWTTIRSLVFAGWITVAIGAFLGYLVSMVWNRGSTIR